MTSARMQIDYSSQFLAATKLCQQEKASENPDGDSSHSGMEMGIGYPKMCLVALGNPWHAATR
jgi:hypothetical protein